MQQRLLAPSSSDVLRIDIRALLWVFFLSFSSRLIDRLQLYFRVFPLVSVRQVHWLIYLQQQLK
jgi:DNA gyrase/topoisomerase IV subunit B